ncbi:hypothetical protein [Mycoplasma seminis]|uniref:Uncharacterized protein n=1 Tax=Mycoplasma seminis TaxID=512749 RepID=A0ABY9HBT8_9MOLU|nr:hypothetical protein [Mycoplasma seminis]WLP85911.1 hypothetical protein Q8852_02075 [Mycoplasma seminis]
MNQKTTKTKKTSKKTNTKTLQMENSSQNDKRFTKLVDSIIKENQQDEFEIKKYRKNKLAYGLAISSILFLVLLVILIILAITLKWGS